ncbi:hypothetical protein HMPREF9123_2046 [Neisseria bacilliformis ATCC BAA-1200]|uniref:Uncharacterized protein n=1 Tax=Neisseria bacilliformis ATCC BAA-1200 TaxID=888742 RepID=F2BE90_9NEIS|nr:hypothetical protein HMPREF9123_2046 [Neisseria bacilliformis ATCC BAA-1200]
MQIDDAPANACVASGRHTLRMARKPILWKPIFQTASKQPEKHQAV